MPVDTSLRQMLTQSELEAIARRKEEELKEHRNEARKAFVPLAVGEALALGASVPATLVQNKVLSLVGNTLERTSKGPDISAEDMLEAFRRAFPERKSVPKILPIAALDIENDPKELQQATTGLSSYVPASKKIQGLSRGALRSIRGILERIARRWDLADEKVPPAIEMITEELKKPELHEAGYVNIPFVKKPTAQKGIPPTGILAHELGHAATSNKLILGTRLGMFGSALGATVAPYFINRRFSDKLRDIQGQLTTAKLLAESDNPSRKRIARRIIKELEAKYPELDTERKRALKRDAITTSVLTGSAVANLYIPEVTANIKGNKIIAEVEKVKGLSGQQLNDLREMWKQSKKINTLGYLPASIMIGASGAAQASLREAYRRLKIQSLKKKIKQMRDSLDTGLE